MCIGWVEGESQYKARKGELESVREDLRAAGDKEAPAHSHWLQQYRFARTVMNVPFQVYRNCTGESQGREQKETIILSKKAKEEIGWK